MYVCTNMISYTELMQKQSLFVVTSPVIPVNIADILISQRVKLVSVCVKYLLISTGTPKSNNLVIRGHQILLVTGVRDSRAV